MEAGSKKPQDVAVGSDGNGLLIQREADRLATYGSRWPDRWQQRRFPRAAHTIKDSTDPQLR